MICLPGQWYVTCLHMLIRKKLNQVKLLFLTVYLEDIWYLTQAIGQSNCISAKCSIRNDGGFGFLFLFFFMFKKQIIFEQWEQVLFAFISSLFSSCLLKTSNCFTKLSIIWIHSERVACSNGKKTTKHFISWDRKMCRALYFLRAHINSKL